ncbi:nascent polypeptide-associated complex protein [Candidatus Bathyarchaeota archaeon]|nr:MAG: nascent polypeptide-associated complex protein [Candidatus Bathyarchaeota archaeon]
MRRISPRAMRRMMRQMGMNMRPLEGVEEVVLRLPGKRLVIEEPEVIVVELGGQTVYQVVPGRVREELAEEKPAIPEEDVQLVAQQAGVSLEEARAALEKTGGDLAKAILLLMGQEG